MPLYEYECPSCHNVEERILTVYDMERYDKGLIEKHEGVFCSQCDCLMRHIITSSGEYCANQDAEWIRSVREVVDKEDSSQATQRFLKEPTRANLKRWMKDKGLRHLEQGEGLNRVPLFDEARHLDKVMEYRRKERRLEI